MILDRRTFIVGTGAVAMTPALELWPLPALAAEAGQVEFMIDGWSMDDGNASRDRVWIKLDRSWRSAWR